MVRPNHKGGSHDVAHCVLFDLWLCARALLPGSMVVRGLFSPFPEPPNT